MNSNATYLFFIFLFFFQNIASFAQEGDLYLYNYQIPIDNIDNQNLAVTQGRNGIMYFANKKGVMSYDGVSWQIITTSNTPYALASDKNQNNKVYVGCRESFGYIATDKKGLDYYVSISKDQKNFGEIIRIILTKEFGYFYSDKALFKISLANNQIIKVWKSTESMTFQGIALLGNKIYLQIKNKGIHEIRNDKLEVLPETQMYSGLYLRTSVEFDKNSVLLGMSNSWAYFFDGKKMQLYVPTAKEYLKNNVIHAGLSISEKEIAFATLSGGVIVINKADYSTKTILNFQTGLPDDEVFSIATDEQGGLWICHAKGITRADVSLPIRAFSGFAGLDGNIETVITLSDTLFVGTSDGLYFLNKVEKFEQIENLIRKEQRYLKTVETITKTVKIRNPESENKFRIFNHSNSGQKQAKRKIEIEESKETEDIPKRTLSTELTTSLFSTAEARKAYALQSIPFVFKKVAGVDSKVRQFVKHQNKILVASNSGLYEIAKNGQDLYAKVILKDEYINFIYPSTSNPNVLFIGTDRSLIMLENQSNTWINKEKWENTAVYSILEHKNALWLGVESQVFKIPLLDKGKLGVAKAYQFKESYSENITVRFIKDEPAFILTSGIYSYSPEKDIVFKNSHLQKYFNPYSPIFYNQIGYTWLKKTAWQNLSNTADKGGLKTVFLEFFGAIQEIYVDERKNIWLIDNNFLYRINAEAQFKETETFNVFIRNAIQNIANEKDQFLPLENLSFSYQQKGLSFSFKMASPFYRNEPAIEYQYWLEGLSETWTEWDTKAVVSYPYVPVGKYKLHVKARNIFGQVSKEQIFSFEIKPPFWQTYWFYGLQFSILAGLLLLSFFFNRRGKNPRVSIVITIVAIITLFEFLVFYFEPFVDKFVNGIPIFKLGMNILLALILLPAEHYLRHWLQKPAKRIAPEELNEPVPERIASTTERSGE